MDHFAKYGLEKGPPASEAALDDLQEKARLRLPDDYLSFLRWSDGAAGWVGVNYLAIHSVEDMVWNPYPFEEFIPGFFIFGGDGGGDLYAFDTRSDPMPLVQIDHDVLDSIEPLTPTFSDFLEFLVENDLIEVVIQRSRERQQGT